MTKANQAEHFQFDKSRFRKYIGDMGEMVAQEALMKQGFSIWSLHRFPQSMKRPMRTGLLDILAYLYRDECESVRISYDRDMTRTYERHVKELKNFLGDRFEGFVQYLEEVGTPHWYVGLERKPTYCPDLVAKRNGEIYVVEIKVGQGIYYLRGDKLKGFTLAKKYGFIPMLITLDLTIEAGNLRFKQL